MPHPTRRRGDSLAGVLAVSFPFVAPASSELLSSDKLRTGQSKTQNGSFAIFHYFMCQSTRSGPASCQGDSAVPASPTPRRHLSTVPWASGHSFLNLVPSWGQQTQSSEWLQS